MRVLTKGARAGLEFGLAVALTMGAIGAGYVAGKTSLHNHRPMAEMAGQTDHAAEARMEGLLLLLLGRGGVL